MYRHIENRMEKMLGYILGLYSVNTSILFKNREQMFLQREIIYAILK